MSYLVHGQSALWRAHNTNAQGTMSAGESFNLEFSEGARLAGDDVLTKLSYVYADTRVSTSTGVQFDTLLLNNTGLESSGFNDAFVSTTTVAALTDEDGTYGIIDGRTHLYIGAISSTVTGTGASPEETRLFGIRLAQ